MSARPVSAADDKEPESRVPARARKLGAFGWTMLVAGLAFASSTVALIFTVWPGLKPDPREALGADLSVFAVDPNVTYREWITTRSSFSDSEATERLEKARLQTPGLLRIRGEVVYVRMRVQGFKRRSVAMRASIYEASSRVRVQGVSNIEVASQQLGAPTDQTVVPVWLPCPPNPAKKYYARVELYHRGDEVLLAVSDSEGFSARCA
jgi:hypothetical protein